MKQKGLTVGNLTRYEDDFNGRAKALLTAFGFSRNLWETGRGFKPGLAVLLNNKALCASRRTIYMKPFCFHSFHWHSMSPERPQPNHDRAKGIRGIYAELPEYGI